VSEVAVAALRVWLRGGERNAPKAGAACLAGRMLEEGSVERDWRQVATAAEDRGISISAAGGYEALGLALNGPAVEVERMIAWAAELALAPRFDAERWEWQRQLAAAELAALRDEPDALTGWSFLGQVYGNHPRGRPLAGSAAGLLDLSVEDSRHFHGRALANGLIISLAGAIDPEEAARRLAEAFADGERPSRAGLEEPEPPRGGPRRGSVSLPGDQAHLFLGKRTVTRHHEDLPALELAAVVLGAGAGLAGRIPERVREREGLAYTASVDTAAGASQDVGRFVLYAATSPERVERAELVMREELDRFLAEGASAAELAAARSYLEGHEIFRRESARQWADLLVEAELTGLAIDSPNWAAERWASVTVADLRAAAERWLDPSGLSVTVGLPAAANDGEASS
jgi:zinc protease